MMLSKLFNHQVLPPLDIFSKRTPMYKHTCTRQHIHRTPGFFVSGIFATFPGDCGNEVYTLNIMCSPVPIFILWSHSQVSFPVLECSLQFIMHHTSGASHWLSLASFPGSLHTHTASNRKQGGAWEQGYRGCRLAKAKNLATRP